MKSFFTAFFVLMLSTQACALYDPTPSEFLSAVEGTWAGTLEYRDYQPPNRHVTLPTKLYVSLVAPNELSLHYVFDDGPKKIVHSYELLQVDLAKKTLRWSGLKPEDTSICTIVSTQTTGDAFEIVAERKSVKDGKKKLIRYRLKLAANNFEIRKDEGADATRLSFADRYSFQRK